MAKMAEQVIGCHTSDHWKEQLAKGKDSGKVIVVDFTASWCGPCRFIAPILDELAKKYPNLLFLKVDVDELKSVAEEFKVEAMPTIVFLKEGVEIEGSRLVGANKDKLEKLVEKYGAESSA